MVGPRPISLAQASSGPDPLASSSSAPRPTASETESAGPQDAFLDLIRKLPQAIVVLDMHGVVRYANDCAHEWLAADEPEFVGRRLPFALDERGPASIVVEHESADGDRGRLSCTFTPTTWSGEPAFLVRIEDATERLRIAERAEDLAARFALLERAVNDGLWEWDLVKQELALSSRWKAMLGYSERELGTSPNVWFDRVHPDDIEPLKTSLGAHLQGRTPCVEVEYRIQRRDGGWRWMSCRALASRSADGRALRMIGSQADITEQKDAKEELARRAFYDSLTDMPNRALFLDRLWHAMRRARRKKDYLFAVLFLDLDRFKVVNDSLGHMAGDQLLIMIARRLEKSLRPGDTVARLGGDEFTVLLDDIKDSTDATQIAERIQSDLSAPFRLRGQELVTTGSMGIALSSSGYDRPEDILRDADTAMYRAKSSGRARHVLFDTDMHDQAVALLELEGNLHHAVERDELLLHYQPIIDLASGRITAVEALVRWQHPRRGLLLPGEFVPVAEETGQIIALGRWVLRRACRQLVAWSSANDAFRSIVVNVNLSSKQFSLPDLLPYIQGVLEEIGLPPGRLRLEITESALIENPEIATRTLLELKLLGVQISLDDFGTGYSSLSYLQRFPIDTLKIDRSFVSRMDRDEESLEIARTVLNIGRNLGKSVVAEGIETHDQLRLLRQLDCDCGQGFLLSRPLEPAAAEALILSAPAW